MKENEDINNLNEENGEVELLAQDDLVGGVDL